MGTPRRGIQPKTARALRRSLRKLEGPRQLDTLVLAKVTAATLAMAGLYLLHPHRPMRWLLTAWLAWLVVSQFIRTD